LSRLRPRATITKSELCSFSGKYEHRLIAGGIGHNLPQAFVKAVVDVDHLAGRIARAP
jgi:hypothetical protein